MKGSVFIEKTRERAKIIKITQKQRTGANNENKYRMCVNICDRDIQVTKRFNRFNKLFHTSFEAKNL